MIYSSNEDTFRKLLRYRMPIDHVRVHLIEANNIDGVGPTSAQIIVMRKGSPDLFNMKCEGSLTLWRDEYPDLRELIQAAMSKAWAICASRGGDVRLSPQAQGICEREGITP